MDSVRSQKIGILKHLKENPSKGITPIDALNLFGCFRLSARIWDLKEDGCEIKTVKESKNKKTYARYFLVSDNKNKRLG